MKAAVDLETQAAEVRASPKYRGLDLPTDTVSDLLQRELAAGRTGKEALKAARAKLHTIVAPYLGDPDYQAAERRLDTAFASGDAQTLQETCRSLLACHASTRERLPYLGDLYRAIFAVTGVPQSVLDLACGLNPLALPWMGLARETRYLAYDLHAPRVGLINRFLSGFGQTGMAIHQDILLKPPRERAEVGFFFKEAHRFEQRQRGCNRDFWLALDVDWLVVTLPALSLSGQHDKREQQRRLVTRTLAGLPWLVNEFEIGGEMVFCMDRRAGDSA